MSIPEVHHFNNLLTRLSAIPKNSDGSALWSLRTIQSVSHKEVSFEIPSITFGSTDPQAPVLGFVGGVHGLERIGSRVALSMLRSFVENLILDESLRQSLQSFRIFFVPYVNPVGIHFRTRSNGNGVDLMRNSPVEADKSPFLLGGQRHSPKIPWYRGAEGQAMQPESQALCDEVLAQVKNSVCSIVIDIHSGFGLNDQLWFPFAHTKKVFPQAHRVLALKKQMEKVYPHHIYQIEPQAANYTTHGDLWDHLFYQKSKIDPHAVFLPLTLELGSWIWVKKNPFQLFRSDGAFNPSEGHRDRRVLRRHLTLLEFLIRAVRNFPEWVHDETLPEVLQLKMEAERIWYGH